MSVVAVCAPVAAFAQQDRPLDVPYVPTPQAVVDRMLELARLQRGERLVDLGSGDGRLVITAAKRGAVAHGIEYNADMVAFAQKAAAAEGVSDRATFEKADIFESDFSRFDVVTLFLLPDLNLRLRPTLLDMKPGTRVLSNSFGMGDWEPDQTVHVNDNCSNYCNGHLWIVPARVDGRWRLDGRELVLKQTYQKLEGTLGGKPLRQARLSGTHIQFVAGGRQYRGEVRGERMGGRLAGGAEWSAQRR